MMPRWNYRSNRGGAIILTFPPSAGVDTYQVSFGSEDKLNKIFNRFGIAIGYTKP